jgi:small-conductance mechanosensitive channel
MENITEEKNIGSLSFSYINIILFFMVIIISSLISKVVSFLSSDTSGTIGGKNKIGSWLLLIRIGIMTFGVLLAFIISGFPIDRITIILSALGVGIGLGLQSITNNLVSGLIIAFEKPVNIGDTIEVGGQIGSMKYMGVRSSVITTPDGADVIIPNGELLNQNLTNWTLNSTRRRYEIKLGVSYGTDLQKIKDLLHEILNSNDKVLKIPEPTIWVVNFNDSSIDFSIKFWVGDLMFGNEVLSNILIAIDTEFKKHNIEIPFPQRDIHIISKKDE